MTSARLEAGRNGPSEIPKTANEAAPAVRAARRDLAIVVGLVVLAVGTLWPVVTFDFLNYDDYYYVSPHQVQEGLNFADVGWALGQVYGYYIPITMFSHMLDCQLFGMNPAGHHAANLFYHVCAVIVLFWLLRRMTGRPWCSAVAAGLFAIHPLNAGTVAWISSRRDVLSTLLGLLALLAYARYAAAPAVRRYVPVIMLFTMSMMAKPAFMPFPVVMLFLDFWPLKRMEDLKFGDQAGRTRFFWLVAEKVPLFVIAFGAAVLAYLGQSAYGAVKSSDTYPFLRRAANAVNSYLMYMWKGLWPTGLALPYPYPAILWWKTAGMLALLAAFTAFAILCRKRFPYVFVGWFWYGLVLLPSSGILAQLGDQSSADRYAYVPMIGLFVAAACGLGDATRHWRKLAVAAPVAVIAALAAYAAAGNIQVRYWSDSATLFRHAIDVTSGNYMAYAFLGKTLADQGRDEEGMAALRESLRLEPNFILSHIILGNVQYKKGLYGEAVGHFTEALRDNPRDAAILYNMGLALLAQDKYDEAITYFRQAIAAKPDLPLAHNNLGYGLAAKGAFEEAVVEYREALRAEPKSTLVLYNMGDALLAQGKCEEAIQCYTHAAEADPEKRNEALNKIGDALVSQGKNDEAIAEFRKAIAVNPEYALAHINLGYEFARKSAFQEAIAEYREALRIDSKSTLALTNLGDAFLAQDKGDEAIKYYTKVADVDPPKRHEALNNIGNVLVRQGKSDEAIAQFRKALAVKPDFALAHNNLGYQLACKGALADAVAEYREALRIDPRSTLALINLGNALADLGEPDEAAAQYRKVLEVNPKDEWAYYKLATAAAGQGKREEAVALYQKAQDNAPGNANIANDLALALGRLGRVEECLAWFQKAIKIDPQSVLVRENWGRVLAGQKRYAEACDQFSEALKIAPQNARIREALEAARGALQGTGPASHNPAVTVGGFR